MAVRIRYSCDRKYFTCKDIKELKPCPFCGGKDLTITPRSGFKRVLKEHGRATISMSCTKCHIDMYEHSYNGNDFDTKAKILIEKWNERKGE